MKDTGFDYIVIGSATGGVVASRLAQQNYKVLLIEAGPDDLTYSCKYDNNTCVASPFGNLIAGTPLLSGKTEWFLSYSGQKDVEALKWDAISMPSFYNYNKTLLQRSNDLLRAKMLGGCMSHNGQVWTRGSTRDFDYIAQKYNLLDWSYQNVFPFFQKSETYFGNNGNKTLRGANGPIEIRIRNLQNWQYQSHAFFNACIEFGIPYNNHQNSIYPETGIGIMESNIGKYKNGKLGLFDTKYYRSGSAQSYIRDIGIKSGYLTVWCNTIVQRILFDNAIKKNAIGVEYYDRHHVNTINTIYCKKEVILSAGTYQSPQLLMLSGIGPMKELNKFNITPIYINNNIGRYGQDHIYFWYNVQLKMNQFKRKLKGKQRHVRPKIHTIMNTLKNQMEFFDITGGLNIFLSSGKYDRLGYDYNDIRIFSDTAGGLHTNKYRIGIDVQLYSKNLSVHLNSSDARIYPIVYQNFFADSRDYDQILQAIFALRKILFNNSNNKKSNSVFIDKLKHLSIENWRDKIWTQSVSSVHAVGTVKMGYDSMFPIDSKCSVKGVNNLRVVDISIWPESTNGGTQSLAYLIGEKCAQHIINHHKYNSDSIENNAYVKKTSQNNNINIINFIISIAIFICICLMMIIFTPHNGSNKLFYISKSKRFKFVLGTWIIYSLLCFFHIIVFNNYDSIQ